jgi:hypothetical protein
MIGANHIVWAEVPKKKRAGPARFWEEKRCYYLAQWPEVLMALLRDSALLNFDQLKP